MEKDEEFEENDEGFIRRPYSFFKNGYKGYGGAIAGLFYSYSNAKKRPNATFVGSMTQISERVGCCKSTVQRHINRLKKEEGFTQVTTSPNGRRLPCGVYTYKPDHVIPYMTTNMALYDELTPKAVDVFSHVMTQSRSPRNGKGVFYGTPNSISQTLNMNITPVRQALKELYRKKFVFRTQTVVNGYGTNKYEIPEKIIARYRAFTPKEEQRQEESVTEPWAVTRERQETVRKLNERADMEIYYTALKAKAEAQAETVRNRLLADAEYKAAYSERRRLEITLVKAERNSSEEELRKIREKLAELKEREEGAMRRLKIRPRDLIPKRHCKKCSDTGFLPDGRPCDCYKPKKK